MDSPRLRLLIIDDHPLFRKGAAQIIAMADEFTLVGEASGGVAGIEMARRHKPYMILLDLNMRDLSGLEVLATLREDLPDTRIVMLTVSDEASDLVGALRAGADGYLLKEMEPEELLAKLREAAAGQFTLTARLTHLLARSLREDSRPRRPEEAGLTEQEMRILELIAGAKSNKVIARELGIAEGTVKVHVKHLLKKLNLRSRVEAAVWAVQRK